VPGICPRCDRSDQVRDVQAIFAARRNTSTLLDPAGDVQEAFRASAAAAAVTGLAAVVAIYQSNNEAAVDSGEAAGYLVLLALGVLITVSFAARWIRRWTWTRQLRVSQSAYELWATAWYCYRCRGVFFPAERPGVSTTELMAPDRFRQYIRAEARKVRRQ
jgi:hypothetical protein